MDARENEKVKEKKMVIYLTEQQLVENPVILRGLKSNIKRNGLELAKEYVNGMPILVSPDGKHGWNEGILLYKRLWLKAVAKREVKLDDLKCNTFDELDGALSGMMYAELETDHVRGSYLDGLSATPGLKTFEFKDISFDVVKDGVVNHVKWDSRVYSGVDSEWAEAALLNDIRFFDAPAVPYIIEPHDMKEPTLRKAEMVDGEPVVGEDELLFWNTGEGYEVRNIKYASGLIWSGCPDGISPMTKMYWENLGLGEYYEYIARYRLGQSIDRIPHDVWMNFPNWTSGTLDMYFSIKGYDYSGKKILQEVHSQKKS